MTEKDRGFTLIELVTVMAVMGIVLFFTLPRFDAFNPFGASVTPTGKLLLLIEQLKSQTLEAHQGTLLHMNTTTGRVWVTVLEAVAGEADALEKESASEPLILFSEDSEIEDVTMPGRTVHGGEDGDDITIGFSRDGFSDPAFIHIRENDREFTVVIEPFLCRAQLLEGHVSCGQ